MYVLTKKIYELNVAETDTIIDQVNMLFTQGIHQFSSVANVRASYAIFLLEISQVLFVLFLELI